MIILNGFYISISVLVCVARIFKIMFKIVKHCKMYSFHLFKVITFDEIDNTLTLGADTISSFVLPLVFDLYLDS